MLIVKLKCVNTDQPVLIKRLFLTIFSNTFFISAFILSTLTLEKPCCRSWLIKKRNKQNISWAHCVFLKFFFLCVCKFDYETVHQGWTMLKNQLAKTTLLSSEHPSLLSVLQNLDHSGNQSELPLTNSWPYDKIPYRPITCYVDSLN